METIGLIAGEGKFPLIFARAAKGNDLRVVAVAHLGQTLPELEKYVDEITWVRVGQLGKTINALKKAGVTNAVMAGGIAKSLMYFDIHPDLKGLMMMARLKNRKDDVILRAVAEEMEKEGIVIRDSTLYLSSLLAPQGVLTRRAPSPREMEDIRFGWEIAKEIGRLDIGQSVVVKDKNVLAVEAIEGTDAAIKRGGGFAGKGAVLVKVSKPNQDLRFDIPVIGLDTIRVMAEAQVTAAAIEAGRTIIFDKESTISYADQESLALVALDEGRLHG